MATSLTVPITLELPYQHSLGGYSPYFRGLLEGRAMASHCRKCGKAWCPPNLTCPEDAAATEWIELAGTGTLLSATETAGALPLSREVHHHVFGLVRLDGATNAMFARLALTRSQAKVGTRLKLQRAPGVWPHPSQAAQFVLLDP